MDNTLRWGTMKPEAVVLERATHKAIARDVFFTKCVGGFYVTSSIRCKIGPKPHQVRHVGNMFAGGKTLSSAVHRFVKDFKTKTYNV